jgi:hypothetical protein
MIRVSTASRIEWVHFIMLHTLVKNMIGHNLNDTYFVSMNWRGCAERSQTQLANLLEQATNITRYSGSIRDLDMRAYFLLF